MPMIREVIVTTVDRSGHAHMAPLGLIEDGDGWIIAPFLPSVTHDNLLAILRRCRQLYRRRSRFRRAHHRPA